MGEYEDFAKYYDIINQNRFDYQAEALGLSKIFREHHVKTVLDCSCGTGSHLVHLAKLGYQCVGNDLSENMLAIAKEKVKKAGVESDFINSDLRTLSVEQKFDAVYSLHALSLFENETELMKALQNMYHVLDVGGVIVCDFLNGVLETPPFLNGLFVETNETDDIKIVQMHNVRKDGNHQHWETIFLIDDHGQVKIHIYRRKLLLFHIEEVKAMFEKLGFTIKSILGTVTEIVQSVKEKSPDIVIIATKMSG